MTCIFQDHLGRPEHTSGQKRATVNRLGLVLQRADNAIRRIEIYPADSVIHPWNNRGLLNSLLHNLFIKKGMQLNG